jgi:surfeit locus 1 family protein
VLRTVLTPRWLGSLVAVLALLALFIWLGLWQLGVAKDTAKAEALAAAPARPTAPLETILTPHQKFPGLESSRRVVATGRYDAGGQVLVLNRRLNGVSGSWIVTPLIVESTGARLAVLRAFTTATSIAEIPPPAQVGTVTVVGSLAPPESPVDVADAAPGELGAVDLAHLANQWPGELYNAFIFGISESPEATLPGPPAVGLQRVPPPAPDPGMTLRNTAYAYQWWIFGIFALWMWWKMVRDAHRRCAQPR